MNQKKVILLTGANGGLGKVVAQHLISKGHIVYGTSRNEELVGKGGVHWLVVNINSDDDCMIAIRTIVTKEGRLDTIVNNAGITLSGPTLEFSTDDFKKIFDTNVIGPFRLIKAAYSFPTKPELIVNITSLNGFMSYPNFGIYSASKFAMEALGFALRYELAPSTKVVNVAPGAIHSETSNKMSHKSARERIPFLKWLMPLTLQEDVAIVIGKLIIATSVPPRVLVGRDAYIINMLQKILPSTMFDKIIFYIWGKK
ncbi:MAG: SDR family NAD(P)-dependent oxidoreductase [Thiobacillus sp.]|nr:SDR family NAD(P)-dependent oxidoreductase [Thiobacillus sp.]